MIPATRGPAGLRRHRRRLLLWSALPVLLTLCLSAKLISAGYLAGAAAQAFDAREGAGVAAAASGLGTANFFETHKAPFAEGDALVLAGDFTGARQRFEEALAQASPEDECVIRVNLVLSIERLGDARLEAKDPTAAGGLFDEGIAVVEAAPDGCFPPASGSGESCWRGWRQAGTGGAAASAENGGGEGRKRSAPGAGGGRREAGAGAGCGKPKPARSAQGQRPRIAAPTQ